MDELKIHQRFFLPRRARRTRRKEDRGQEPLPETMKRVGVEGFPSI